MMLMLGNYRFSLDNTAYQSRSRSTSYRWGKQDRLTTEPALQYLGPGDDTISLRGLILPHYKGGLEQIESMRRQAEKGNALLLLEGTGKVLERWVIKAITEDQSVSLKTEHQSALNLR